jgi:glycosyltransferase involved in cell wall biosynthesis
MGKPRLSIIVILYDMPQQAANTLHSLSAEYQLCISPADYEVVVVENSSANNLSAQCISALPQNFRYFLRDEKGVTPAPAINFGFAQCEGEYIGLIIDGARLLSPRALHFAFKAYALNRNAMAMIPAYHLGDKEQAEHAADGYGVTEEQHYLKELDWREDGYRLFNRCVPSPGNRHGYLVPFFECCTLFAHRQHFQRIGPADERFNLRGGGSINLHILRALGISTDIEPVVLLGEGSFHQMHGGVTTTVQESREHTLKQFNQQLNDIWGGEFQPLSRQPTLLGTIPANAYLHFEHACQRGKRRYDICKKLEKEYWIDDVAIPKETREYHSSVTLSIIVIVYDMPRQAMNTLRSLAASYQQGVEASDYEIIVVENRSKHCLIESEIYKLDGNYRYFLRDEVGISPSCAINFGVEQASGNYLGLLIDGARMITPGAVKYVFAANRIYPTPLVAVPGYEFNSAIQSGPALCADAEQQTLKTMQWEDDGYRLFEQAVFSEANDKGYLHPLMECGALFFSKASFNTIGGANEDFDKAGGGSLNLHLYRSLGMIQNNQLVITPGEGSFHQFHGGVTSNRYANRDEVIAEFNEQLNSYWEGQYKALTRAPVLLGKISYQAHPFLQLSCLQGKKRHRRLTGLKQVPWPDDDILIQEKQS